MKATTRVVVAAAISAQVLMLTACGVNGVQDLPLPGGADLGSEPFRVTAQFEDVLDLVPQAAVKVNDVPVGRVSQIRIAPDGRTAEVVMDVSGDVHLAAGATVQLRQSSLLGEKYVLLAGPQGDNTGDLRSGDYIPIARTHRSPEVEEVLGALSMLLNGGGVGQIQNITRELNAALSGREADIKQLLSTVEVTTRELDAQRGDITHAINGLNALSESMAGQQKNFETTLDHIGPGLEVINQQRGQLVTMLQSLDRLSEVSVDTVNRSKEDMVASLEALSPTLQKLSEAGSDLPNSLQLLATFPFTDYMTGAIKGDYTNADFKLDLDLGSVLNNLTPPSATAPGQQGGDPRLLPPLPVPQPQPTEDPPVPPSAPREDGGLLGGLLGGGS